MRDGLKGIARSMPTSAAADRVADDARHPAVRDADRLEVLRQPARRRHGDDLRRGERRHRLRPCPREGRAVGGAALAQHPRRAPASRSTRSCAITGRRYGRNYYARHDYEGVDSAARRRADGRAARQARRPAGSAIGGLTVATADDFAYTTRPTARSARNQGVRVLFDGGSRVVFRLSGTGTSGATLRVYLERYEPPTDDSTARRRCSPTSSPRPTQIAGIVAPHRPRRADVVT